MRDDSAMKNGRIYLLAVVVLGVLGMLSFGTRLRRPIIAAFQTVKGKHTVDD